MHKLSVEAPPKILVERYLIEIAKNYNVPYEPDAMVRVSITESDNQSVLKMKPYIAFLPTHPPFSLPDSLRCVLERRQI